MLKACALKVSVGKHRKLKEEQNGKKEEKKAFS
jgi:hypothetical protein